jgi:hypothetical protein
MPYKDKNKAREAARIRVAAWRKKPKNKNKEKERKKWLREHYSTTKDWEKRYYYSNRAKIIERNKKYNSEHKDVRRRAQAKAVFTGKSKAKGRKERRLLKNAYVVALIKREGSNKPVTHKKAEVLRYRIKKILKATNNEK